MANTITPNVGTGVQPQNSAASSASPSDILSQGLPQATPSPQPAPNPFGGQPPTAEVPRGTEPTPSPSPSPSPSKSDQVAQNEQKDIDDLFNKVKEKQPEESKTPEQDQKDIEELFAKSKGQIDPNLPVAGERKPGQSWLDYHMENFGPEAKFMAAKMRANLGDTPLQFKEAFQSMYGDENVKTVGKDLYFRPEKDSKFRKIDQTVWNPIVDLVTSHALESIPGAANMLVQGGIDTAAAGAAFAGQPEALAAVPFAGYAGGATDSATKQALRGVINLFSNKAQTPLSGADSLTAMAQSGENNMMFRMGMQSVGAPLMAAGTKMAEATSTAMGKFLSALGEMGGAVETGPKKPGVFGTRWPSVEAAEKEAGHLTTRLAIAKQGIKEVISQTYPQAAMYWDHPEKFTSMLGDFFEKAEERLGGAVESVKNEVNSLAKDTKAPIDNSLKSLKEILLKHGYTEDTDGRMAGSPTVITRSSKFKKVGNTPLSPSVDSGLEQIGTKHYDIPNNPNEAFVSDDGGLTYRARDSQYPSGLQSFNRPVNTFSYPNQEGGDAQWTKYIEERRLEAVPQAPPLTFPQENLQNLRRAQVTQALDKLKNHYNYLADSKMSDGGISFDELLGHVDNLKDYAQFDKGDKVSRYATRLYKQAWMGAADDRNSFIEQTLKAAQSPNAENAVSEFTRYHDQITAVKQFKKMLATDGGKENFSTMIMQGNKGDKANLLDAAKAYMGEDSDEWRGLQGHLVGNLYEKFSESGPVNAQGFNAFLSSKANEPLVSRLFPSKQDKIVLQKALYENQRIDQTGLMTENQKKTLVDYAEQAVKFATSPAQTVYNLMRGLGSSKLQIEYLKDEGFMRVIEQAEGPELVQRAFAARRYLEGLTDKMKVVDMPSTLQNGTKKSVQRYVPLAKSLAPAVSAISNTLAKPDESSQPDESNP